MPHRTLLTMPFLRLIAFAILIMPHDPIHQVIALSLVAAKGYLYRTLAMQHEHYAHLKFISSSSQFLQYRFHISLYPRMRCGSRLSATAQLHARPASPQKRLSGAFDASHKPSFSSAFISEPVVYVRKCSNSFSSSASALPVIPRSASVRTVQSRYQIHVP